MSNKSVKNRLIKQYGDKCMLCNAKFSVERNSEFHHIKPKRNGGKASLRNGSVLCTSCHTELHKSLKNENYYNLAIRFFKETKKFHEES